jgi:hypothetical protein
MPHWSVVTTEIEGQGPVSLSLFAGQRYSERMHIEEHFRDVHLLRGKKFKWRNIMSIHLERKDLINTQEMEVAIKGPDGATHLILCTGMACLVSLVHETYTFFVGPQLSRRQFVGAMASGALAAIQAYDQNLTNDDAKVALEANLLSIDANYDDEFSKVKVRVEVSSTKVITKLSITYSVNILAELLTM